MSAKEEPSSRTTGLYLLLFVVFLDILSVGLVIPLIPFFAVDLGADAQTIGALGSMYGLLQLFGSVLVGKVSDKFGRKFVLSCSIIGAATSYFAMTKATSLPMLFLSRIPVGILKQTMLISNAMVSDLSNSTDRAKYLGYVSTAASVGYIVGPAVGGVIGVQYGKSVPVYISCILYAFNLFCVIFIMQKPIPVASEEEIYDETNITIPISNSSTNYMQTCCNTKQMIKKLLESYTLMYFLAIQFISSLAQLTFSSTFSQFAFLQYNLDSGMNGYLVAYQSTLEVIVQGIIIGPLTKSITELDLIRGSLFILSLATFSLGMLENFWLVLIVLIPTIFAQGIQSTCLISTITKVVSVKSVGTVLGVAGSLSSICRIISPFIGGIIIEEYGMMGGMSLVSIMSICIVVMLHKHPLDSTSPTVPKLPETTLTPLDVA